MLIRVAQLAVPRFQAAHLMKRSTEAANPKPKKASSSSSAAATSDDHDEAPPPSPNAAGCQLWLIKSEPDDCSIDKLKSAGPEPWHGVRNKVAGGFMKRMRVGDLALFYHSSCKVGSFAPPLASLRSPTSSPPALPESHVWQQHRRLTPHSSTSRGNTTIRRRAWTTRSGGGEELTFSGRGLLVLAFSSCLLARSSVDFDFVEKFPHLVALDVLKSHKDGKLQGLQILRIGRLSICPVERAHWDFICAIGRGDEK